MAALFGLFGRARLLRSVALFFLGLTWVPTFCLAILLLTGIRNWGLPAGLLCLVLLIALWHYLFRDLPRRDRWLLSGLIVACVLLAALFSVCIFDSSCDGRWYHADAVLGLLHGANPVYGQMPAISEPLWVNHYPKAFEYFAALVIHVVRLYQLGKIYHLLLIFSVAAYAGDFFVRQRLRRGDAAMLACLAAVTPICVSQMFSYYVDGAIGSLLTLGLLAVLNLAECPAYLDRIILVLAGSMLVAGKFTGGVYVVILTGLLIAFRVLLRRGSMDAKLRGLLAADAIGMLAAAGLGLLVLGFHPYVTNVLHGHHPLYPVVGSRTFTDVINGSNPEYFRNGNFSTVEKFLISFFSETKQAFSGKDSAPVLKLPLTVRLREITSMAVPDVRFAGWGVLFSGVMLASVLVATRMRKAFDRRLILAILIIVSVSFFNRECYFARYTPALPLLPLFLLLPALSTPAPARWLWGARAICVMMALNTFLCGGAATAATLLKTRRLQARFAEIVQKGGAGDYWAGHARGQQMHYEQFSGLQGITICGDLPPASPAATAVGFAVTMANSGEAEATLYKGSCRSGAPF